MGRPVPERFIKDGEMYGMEGNILADGRQFVKLLLADFRAQDTTPTPARSNTSVWRNDDGVFLTIRSQGPDVADPSSSSVVRLTNIRLEFPMANREKGMAVMRDFCRLLNPPVESMSKDLNPFQP